MGSTSPLNLAVLLFFSLALAFVLVVLSRTVVKTRHQAKLMRLQGEELKKHMIELERRNGQLVQLHQENLQIISLVSHDLKAPFNRIFALIQLMNLEHKNFTDDQKEYLGRIQQIAADGLGMVRNLLDSRRFEEKGVELHEVPFSLSALVATLTKNYSAIADKKKIEIQCELNENIIVKLDKVYLTRVIENLLSNAIKFSPEGKKIVVALLLQKDWIALSVQDQGPGISLEDQKKLYLRFQRLTPRPTGGESSNGLGLFIVKTILDKIGAEITCESTLEQGTCFTVRLPKTIMES